MFVGEAKKSLKALFWIIIIVYIVYALLFIYRTSFVVDGKRYFCLFDDAMISMRYARSLAEGHGFTWNPGHERIEGFTNPLWVIYMALFHLMPIPKSKICLFIQLSGLIVLLINLFLVRIISTNLEPKSALPSLSAVLFTAFYFPLNNWTLQGVEVGVLCLLLSLTVVVTFYSLESDTFSVLPYLFLAVATFIRMDMAVSYLAIMCALVVHQTSARKKHLFIGLSVLGTCLICQSVFRIWYFHEILPNTYYLKMTGYPIIQRLERGLFSFISFAASISFVTFIIPFGTLIFRRDKKIQTICFLFWGQVIYSIYVGGDAWDILGAHNRFLVIVMPYFFVLFGITLSELHSAILGQMKQNSLIIRRYTQIAFVIVIIAALLTFNCTYGFSALGQWILLRKPFLVEDNIKNVKTAITVNQITKDGAIIAVSTAGAIPYFSERFAVDLLGKNDKIIARQQSRVLPRERKYLAFRPGHTKWDLDYTVSKWKPDVIEATDWFWNEARPSLPTVYKRLVTPSGQTDLYIREDSKKIWWNKLVQKETCTGQIQYELHFKSLTNKDE